MLRRAQALAWLLAVSVAAAGAFVLAFAFTPMPLGSQAVEFSIAPGSSLRDAARRMSAAGLPVSERAFTLLARLAGRQGAIKAGSYQVQAGTTPWSLLEKLTQGDVRLTEIAFIEGWTFRQARAALDAHPGVRHDTSALSDAEVMQRLGLPGMAPEGLFFADTYLFARGESDLRILARAHRQMLKELRAAWERRAPDLPYETPEEALILASIVEKETAQGAERARIAGVFANRLKLGMRLQTDPAVIYGLGARFDGNLRRRDLEDDTPFNTYTRAGLPPHPIAMPGRAALLAAVQPERTDALYFVARSDGTHEFSRTLKDHNLAVARYQKPGQRR